MRKELKRILIISGLCFVLLLWCTLKISYKFVTVGLIDPDTCWILALGRNICQHGAVPTSDPFSFTLPLAAAVGAPQPFLVHQWLFDLTTYLIYCQQHLLGLSTFCALMSVIAFICVPWRMALRANAPPLAVYLITLFSAVSVEIRPFVRPEIASCLCFSIWLALLQNLRLRGEILALAPNGEIVITHHLSGWKSLCKSNWKSILAFFVVMLAWCNLHTGFIAGITILAFYILTFALQDLTMKRKFSTVTRTSFVCFIVSVFATLCNPSGFKLWQYLPQMFGVSRYIKIIEMTSLSQAEELKNPDLLPYFFLTAISLFAIFFYIKRRASFRLKITSPLRLGSVVLILASIYGSFTVSRMVPFAVLVLAAESVTLLGRSRTSHSRYFWPRSPLSIWLKSKKVWRSSRSYSQFWDAWLMINTVLAVSFYAYLFPVLALPQVSHNFAPPMGALRFLKTHPQSGPLFNQDLLGAMLTWYLPSVKVFVDPRFDEYGENILKDYINVIDLDRGALGTLNFYGIEWVFVPSDEPLAKVLKRVPAWDVIYSDKDAMIFRRKKPMS